MKRLLLFPTAALLASCNTPPFNVVSIRPIYGWVEGCNAVKVSGSGLAPDATLTMGGVAVPVTERGQGIDEGYWLAGTAPASATGGSGYVDVSITSNGQTDTVVGAYYYVACPALGNVEYVGADAAVAGDAIPVQGCGLDASQVKVQLVDPLDPKNASGLLDLVSDCSTAVAHFSAPVMTDGTYDVLFVDTKGALLYPADYPCTPDSYYGCLPVYTLTYGGAK